MKRCFGGFALAVAFVIAASCAFAEKLPFERYQSILDRMPFGQPPPGFDPTRNPDEVSKDEPQQQQEVLSKEQEEIQRVVQFNAINRDPDGNTMVGFIDKSDPQSAKVYYMAVGETRDGWLVKEADSIEKSMVVEKNGVEVRVTLGENSTSAEKGGAKAKGSKSLAKSSGGGERSSLLAPPGNSAGAQSFKGRRERREAEERATREELERMRAERQKEAEEAAAREAEEKAAREAERAEQREQLLAIQQELKRQREENNARQNQDENSGEDGEK